MVFNIDFMNLTKVTSEFNWKSKPILKIFFIWGQGVVRYKDNQVLVTLDWNNNNINNTNNNNDSTWLF